MQSEENLEKRLEAIQKSVIPVVRLLAGRLGWWFDEREIIRSKLHKQERRVLWRIL